MGDRLHGRAVTGLCDGQAGLLMWPSVTGFDSRQLHWTDTNQEAGMLALSRRAGERVRMTFGDVVAWVEVVEIAPGKVRLSFDAPPEVRIHREEVVPETAHDPALDPIRQ